MATILQPQIWNRRWVFEDNDKIIVGNAAPAFAGLFMWSVVGV